MCKKCSNNLLLLRTNVIFANKPIIIKYASDRLKEDKEIGNIAMQKNKKCYEFLGPELKKDEEILNVLNS